MRGYAHALENFYDKAHNSKESIFTTELVCNLHSAIVEKDPNFLGIPGSVRTLGEKGSIVHIGGLNRAEDSLYNPAPPEFVATALEKIMSWLSNSEIAQMGDAGIGMTLPIRMAIGHSHFEAVHPFSDGNGRVGRALWPLQMIAADIMPLYISGYIEKEKDRYSIALQQAQKQLDYSLIIGFISDAIVSSAVEMELTKEALLSLPLMWKSRGEFRAKSAASNALEYILKTPVFTLESLLRALGCSGPAAANAIKQLESFKIIRERTGNKRNRVFAAEEVIILLSREFGSDIELAMDKAKRILEQ